MINNIMIISEGGEDDDSKKVINNIESVLESDGYGVYFGKYDEETLSRSETNMFELLVLVCDSNNGKEVDFVYDVKSRDIVAFILFMGDKEIEHRIKCLDAGGDDFLPLSIDNREFISKVRSLSRRMKATQEILRVDDLVIDTSTRMVKRSAEIIDLTAREYALLEFLVRGKGKKLSRKDISQNVWGIDFDTGTNVIDVYIKYLREKIKVSDNSKPLIHTVYGYGYIMEVKADTKKEL